jgi:hypothetical protein
MDLREIGWGHVDWIHLTQYRDLWWAVVNAVMNLRVLALRSYFGLFADSLHKVIKRKLKGTLFQHGYFIIQRRYSKPARRRPRAPQLEILVKISAMFWAASVLLTRSFQLAVHGEGG